MTDDKGAGEGPYRMIGGIFDGPNGFNFRIVWGPDFRLDDKIVCEEIIKIANRAHAEGRKAAEKEYKELLEITGFLANVLNEIAYGFVHERDDIPGEGCNCNDDYAKAALELSYEDFIDWRRRHGGLNEKH